jgi:glycosyltransferase involved in cell wall biosynthesis
VPRPTAQLLGLLVRALATRVAVAAEAVAGHYGIPRTACAVVHAPVDTERLTPRTRIPDSRTRRIGLVGNWTWVKGIEVFLEAAARVREGRDGALEIHLVGARLETQRAYAERIDRLVDDLGLADSTIRHGYLEDPERIVAGLDVLVLSSHSEACPQAVLEAMALAVPVAATDVGGVRELLRPESERPAGLVVPPRDPADLARAILDLLADPDRAARMGRNGRALAESDFSLAICAERHRALYEELAGKKI